LPVVPVYHHHAHAAAVAGEYPGAAPILCFTWDGVGLGPDGSLWGGEGLLGRPGAWTRVASFRPFRLPGGERAARETWRSALSLCWESGHAWPAGAQFADPVLRKAFDRCVNAPTTTAVGRLFDAAAALLSICLRASYEGEAAMLLESLCEDIPLPLPLPLPLSCDATGVWRSDWAPLVPAMLDERRTTAARAALLHASLAQALCEQAVAIRHQSGVARVGLSGGVFQNRILTERVQVLLKAAGFEVLIPRCLPVNDAGISYGQLIEAAASHGTHT
jgi:hydrogenase maturation protein HypF